MRVRGDGVGRGAGIAVFFAGVVLLLLVFYLAYVEFVASGALAGSGLGAPAGVLTAAVRAAFLIVLGFVASAVSNKGIALYQAAAGGHAEE